MLGRGCGYKVNGILVTIWFVLDSRVSIMGQVNPEDDLEAWDYTNTSNLLDLVRRRKDERNSDCFSSTSTLDRIQFLQKITTFLFKALTSINSFEDLK